MLIERPGQVNQPGSCSWYLASFNAFLDLAYLAERDTQATPIFSSLLEEIAAPLPPFLAPLLDIFARFHLERQERRG